VRAGPTKGDIRSGFYAAYDARAANTSLSPIRDRPPPEDSPDLVSASFVIPYRPASHHGARSGHHAGSIDFMPSSMSKEINGTTPRGIEARPRRGAGQTLQAWEARRVNAFVTEIHKTGDIMIDWFVHTLRTYPESAIFFFGAPVFTSLVTYKGLAGGVTADVDCRPGGHRQLGITVSPPLKPFFFLMSCSPSATGSPHSCAHAKPESASCVCRWSVLFAWAPPILAQGAVMTRPAIDLCRVANDLGMMVLRPTRGELAFRPTKPKAPGRDAGLCPSRTFFGTSDTRLSCLIGRLVGTISKRVQTL